MRTAKAEKPSITLVKPTPLEDPYLEEIRARLQAGFNLRSTIWRMPRGDDISSVAALAGQCSRDASLGLYDPVLVSFCGLFIDSVGGFPGFYTPTILGQIGPEGVLRLLGRLKDRRATWVVVLAHCTPGGRPVVFERRVEGHITSSLHGRSNRSLKSIFVPKGSRAPISELKRDSDEMNPIALSCRDFSEWYQQHPSQRVR